MTHLASMTREYTLGEIAAMTRVAPAKLLGVADRGHLGPGGLADVAVYHDLPDRAQMFRNAHLLLKNGDVVLRDGQVTHYRFGRALTLRPGYDAAMDRRLEAHCQSLYGLSHRRFAVETGSIARPDPFAEVACRS